MTTDKLRDLLHDQVSDLTMTDLSAAAWRDGQRVRRRRSVAVVGGTAAAALAVTAGVGVLGDDPVRSPAAPSTSTPSGTPTPTTTPTTPTDGKPTSSEPDARYAGAPVWVGPRPEEEAGLPRLEGTGLPEEIDLSAGAPSAAGIGRAVGVLGVWPDGDLSRVVAVGADGASYSVPIEGVLERVTDEGGNVSSALQDQSLSPGGGRVFFIQESSLEVYDFATGAWTHIPTRAWVAEGARWITDTEVWVPERLGETVRGTAYDVVAVEAWPQRIRPPEVPWSGEGEAFGPARPSGTDVAQSHFLAEPLELDGASYAGVNAVVAVVDDQPHVLAFDGLGPRWKGCCPVVGWSAPDTVLFESRQEDARVLAWRVGSHDVHQVSRIVGWVAGQESYAASWAVPGA